MPDVFNDLYALEIAPTQHLPPNSLAVAGYIPGVWPTYTLPTSRLVPPSRPSPALTTYFRLPSLPICFLMHLRPTYVPIQPALPHATRPTVPTPTVTYPPSNLTPLVAAAFAGIKTDSRLLFLYLRASPRLLYRYPRTLAL
jgi:hypothetical protein